MAKAISSEELQLKKRARRRLVGAVALVLFVIVFLPMMLDNEPRQMSQDVSISIPPLAQQNLPEPEPEPESVAREPLRFRPVEPPEGTELAPVPRPEQQQQARSNSESEPVPTPRVAVKQQAAQTEKTSANNGFDVQLGAFSNSGNAARLAAKVRENRFKAYTQVVSTTNGERTRVRVGPYPTRAAAEAARERLKARKLTFGEPTIVRRSE
jgi:DedD protein